MKINMMKLLEGLAQKLMFNLSDEEFDVLLKEIPIILKKMDLIKKIDVTGFEPMHFPFSTSHHQLREDNIVRKISSEVVLSNAAKCDATGYIVINKVIN